MGSDLKKSKAKAWRYFSEYIRLRDALATTGTPFACICCTCGKSVDLGVRLHAGHFIPGRTNSVLFEEKNVHGQCMYCNTFLHGALDKYYVFMLKKYGQDEIDRLEALKHTTTKFNAFDYEEIARMYKQKAKDLINP